MEQTDSQQQKLFSGKDLRRLAGPIVLGQALGIALGLEDTMMIAHVGEKAMSGVSLSNMINTMVINILAALTTGGAVVTSQLIGAGRKQDACRSAKQLIYTTTLIILGISVLMAVFSRQILNLLFGSIEREIFENALYYLLISTASFPFLAVNNAAGALFHSMGRSNMVLWSSFLMNIVNLCGNAVCVMGLGMGVMGVAIPTLLARMAGAAVLYTLLKNPDNLVYLNREKFFFDWPLIKRIMRIAIPGGIENCIFQMGRILVVSLVSGFGTLHIAANSAANSLVSVSCTVGNAMPLVMITVIGRCVGAHDLKQVKYYAGKIMKIAYLFSAANMGLILLGLPWFLELYSLSAQTAQLAGTLMLIHNGIGIFLWPISFVLPSMLRACNDVRFPMAVSGFSMIAFRIGFSYLIGVRMGYGVLGVWTAMVLDWIFRDIFFVGRYLSGKWKETSGLVRKEFP